ncbi:MAG TPA: (E)-4-hydroxy-3-methylbut-2-enyl-diphosphate synthase, partial [Chthoniobacterales bacterium]|nr:(E)-4-hydroxy-3-methylbut-2-enyl-diphosphate synthase [Chthoniobacterales bacterium]
MKNPAYCPDPWVYHRRLTREVKVGSVGVGASNPIRVQSMLTCDTMDSETCIEQTLDLVNVGCEIVRITAPTVKDAKNLQLIKKGLLERGCDVPIVADIHFKPEAALEAARWVEKVRINPGNYADSKKFVVKEYSDQQYEEELERIRARFTPLVKLCRERGISIRIGTNHGSLSDRIMNRYGDTPLGMVESALEFARIARDLGYHDFIFSMKASNPKVMICAYRLLVSRLYTEGADWNYPLHLGVTEAGDGEDGRIKSAIGIGSLLADGLGDTIRVSLTEDSVHEIPVAQALVARYNAANPANAGLSDVASGVSHDGAKSENGSQSFAGTALPFDPFHFEKRETEKIHLNGVHLGGEELIRVAIPQTNFEKIAHKVDKMGDFKPEIVVEESGVIAVDP